MRVSPHQLESLREAIHARFSTIDLAAIAKRYEARGLSATRFRWDMLHASGFDTRELYYRGLTDEHIDTAVRHIVEGR